MKRYLLIFPLLLIYHAAEAADQSPFTAEFVACEAGADARTPQLMECLGKEIAQQDKRLNRSYQTLLGALPKQKQDELRKMQRAWLEFMQRKCSFLYDENDFNGQDDRLNAGYCSASERGNRASELEQLLNRVQ